MMKKVGGAAKVISVSRPTHLMLLPSFLPAVDHRLPLKEWDKNPPNLPSLPYFCHVFCPSNEESNEYIHQACLNLFSNYHFNFYLKQLLAVGEKCAWRWSRALVQASVLLQALARNLNWFTYLCGSCVSSVAGPCLSSLLILLCLVFVLRHIQGDTRSRNWVGSYETGYKELIDIVTRSMTLDMFIDSEDSFPHP